MFVCLAGLALLVISQAAEIPKPGPPAPPPPPPKPGQAGPGPAGPPGPPGPDDEDDEDFGDEEDYEEDYEEEEDEDDEDDEDGEESPEEELSWLLEQHFLMKEDCAEMNKTIAESKGKPDDALKQAYTECTTELKGIESSMRELLGQITAN